MPAAPIQTTDHPMNEATKRLILRSFHLVFSIPLIGYSYSPFDQLPHYAPVVRYVAIPALVLSGVWMWMGRLLSRRGVTRQA